MLAIQVKRREGEEKERKGKRKKLKIQLVVRGMSINKTLCNTIAIFLYTSLHFGGSNSFWFDKIISIHLFIQLDRYRYFRLYIFFSANFSKSLAMRYKMSFSNRTLQKQSLRHFGVEYTAKNVCPHLTHLWEM